MAFARDVYTASAAQTDFTITFPYIAEGDVNVTKDGVTVDNDADADTSSFQIVSSTIVRFGAGLTGGETIVIVRTTRQSTRIVDYASASTLTEEDLDNDSLQAFYMAQEAIDAVANSMILNASDQWDGQSKRIEDVADPTAAQHAATKNYVDTVLVSLGNVPDPTAGQTGYVLAATGAGAWGWTDKTPDVNRYTYAATAAQTAFTGADANANTLSFDTAGLMGVYLNGLLLREGAGHDYTTSQSPDTITLNSGANLNDVLEVVSFDGSLTLADAITQSTGDARYLKLTDGLDGLLNITGVQGDILYHNGSIWTRLGAGTSGDYLETQGAGANPRWSTIATPTKQNWALVGSAAMASGASVDISGISSTATELLVLHEQSSQSSGGGINLDIRDGSSGGTGGLMYIDHNSAVTRFSTGLYRAIQSSGAGISTNHFMVHFMKVGESGVWWGEGHGWSNTGTGAHRSQSAGRIETVTTPTLIRFTTTSGNWDGASGKGWIYEKTT